MLHFVSLQVGDQPRVHQRHVSRAATRLGRPGDPLPLDSLERLPNLDMASSEIQVTHAQPGDLGGPESRPCEELHQQRMGLVLGENRTGRKSVDLGGREESWLEGIEFVALGELHPIARIVGQETVVLGVTEHLFQGDIVMVHRRRGKTLSAVNRGESGQKNTLDRHLWHYGDVDVSRMTCG